MFRVIKQKMFAPNPLRICDTCRKKYLGLCEKHKELYLCSGCKDYEEQLFVDWWVDEDYQIRERDAKNMADFIIYSIKKDMELLPLERQQQFIDYIKNEIVKIKRN